MNETKQVWKDVADILQKSGWPAQEEREGAAPAESGYDSGLPSRPRRNDSAFYHWLPAGAVTSVVVCFLALFFTTNFRRQPLDQNIVEDMQRQLTQAQERLDALNQEQVHCQKAVREAEHSLAETMAKVDKTSASLATVRQSVRELKEDQRKAKEELVNTLKALRALKDEIHVQFSTFNERLKREHDQRLKSIEDIQKHLPRRAVEPEGETLPKR